MSRLRYDLLGCALHGHALAGTGAASLRPEDHVLVREHAGLRWHRCLRCDAWVPTEPPAAPTTEFPPGPDEVEVPLRGKPLRDRYVLRLIAFDRFVHVVVLGALAVVIFLFARHKIGLERDYIRILNDIQGGAGGPAHGQHGLLGEIQKAFRVSPTHLYYAGGFVAAYALLEGVEMVGLWRGRRWAEYLTFVATSVLLPLEVYELGHSLSVLKAVTFAINLAIVVYLLLAKRLFGLRGGGRAVAEERERDSGWPAVLRATPTAPGPTS
ncbi:MAG TPA: DUF2127 domain-containing protein [Mycobacteriales bacterium]|nr:DUF2127 domain-containing protein [Mycobacteriales bacterium]